MGNVNVVPNLDAAAARGTAIGTTIKAVIDTAFPVITPVVDAISKLFSRDKKQDEQKVQDTVKAELKKQKEEFEQKFKDYRAALKVSANAVKQLNELSKQADLTNKYLNIVRTYAKVEKWDECKAMWDKAETELDNLAKYEDREKLQDQEAKDAIGIFFEKFEYKMYKDEMKAAVLPSNNYWTITVKLERALLLTISLTQISSRCLRDLLVEATKD